MLKDYGLIKGKVDTYESELKLLSFDEKILQCSPHYNFSLLCNGAIYNANINIFSKNPAAPDLKIFCSENPIHDLKNVNVFLKVQKLKNGVYKQLPKELSLDYLREKYFDFSTLAEFINKQEGEKMFLYNTLDKHLRKAKENN